MRTPWSGLTKRRMREVSRRRPAPGGVPGPVSDWELASRLSYFLWSSVPDAELRQEAAAGRLHEPDVLLEQTRRLLGDAHVRRLATEFACQWLGIYSFDEFDSDLTADNYWGKGPFMRIRFKFDETTFYPGSRMK